MSLLTFKQKINKIQDITNTLCPICEKKEIEQTVIQVCDETDTLVDYDLLLHTILTNLYPCLQCQSKKEQVYEE